MKSLYVDELQQYREDLITLTEEQLARENKELCKLYYEEQGLLFRQILRELLNKCNDEITIRWTEEHQDLFM